MNFNREFYKENNSDEESINDKKIFELIEKNANIDDILNIDSSLNTYLNLTSIKQNLLSWYDFKSNSSVLEIGSNFGELVDFLCSKFKVATVIEENLKKAQYIANKYKNINNLNVYAGNLKDVKIKEKFDYIIISNYLEKHSVKDVVNHLKEYLKNDGIILLAVDNKYGIKYWNGKDDYKNLTGKNNKCLYGKNELQKIIEDAGYKKSKFYYIFPEYKAPNIIYTDEYDIDIEDISRNFELNEENQKNNFRENDVLKQILNENKKQVNFFANSFLVEISDEAELNDTKYITFTNYRKKEKQIQTIIKPNFVIKKAINSSSEEHIKQVISNMKYFPINECKLLDESNENESIKSKFINAPKLDEIIINSSNIKNEFDKYKNLLFKNVINLDQIDKNDMLELFEKYDNDLLNKLHYLEYAFVDMIPKNCFVINNENCFFDQEWMLKNLPAEYVLYRAIMNTADIDCEEFIKYYELDKYTELFKEIEEYFTNQIMDKNVLTNILNKVTPNRDQIIDHLNELIKIRDKNIEDLTNISNTQAKDIQTLFKNIEEKNKSIQELDSVIQSQRSDISKLNYQIEEKDTQLVDINKQLAQIYNSISWKIMKPFRKIFWIINPLSGASFIDRILIPGSPKRIKYDQKQAQKKYDKKVENYFKLTDNDTAEFWKGIDHRKYLKYERDLEKEKRNELTNYEKWMKANDPTEQELEMQAKTKFAYNPKISIIVPLYNTNTDFFRELLYSLHCQTYSNWELCLADGSPEELKDIQKMCEKDDRIKYKFINGNLGISGNTNEALKLATGDYIALLDHDDMLTLNALYEVVKAINENEKLKFIYTDEDKMYFLDESRFDPHFKPDFAVDTLRSGNYICHFSVFKKELMDKIVGFREEYDGAQDFDIILRATEECKKDEIKHIAKILYHWRVHPTSTAGNPEAKLYAYESGEKAVSDHLKRCGLSATVKMNKDSYGYYLIDYDIIGNPKVSILIPNINGIKVLKKAVQSILEKTTYKNYEIIIIDDLVEEEEKTEYYNEIKNKDNIKIIYYKDEFNYSKMINFAVKECDGEYIVQFNSELTISTDNWLEKMIGYAQREDVGAVGGQIYYSDDTVKNAGIVIGKDCIAVNLFTGVARENRGYFGRKDTMQNMSAVSQDCIMSKREIYEKIDYMNESLPRYFNNIDFCLRIRENEKFIIYNPLIQFIVSEEVDKEIDSEQINKEKEIFLDKWQTKLEQGDEYYNKNLSLESGYYEIRTDKV